MIRCSFSYVIISAFFLTAVTGQYDNCTGQPDAINNGRCDSENNIIECDYDGGDCCYCSCKNDNLYPCGIWGYNCLDPDATNNADGCQRQTTSFGHCQTNASQTWVVNDTASAALLADAVNCSGGTFDVRWQGSVLIERTISIPYGTTVYVTGEGSGAEISGGGRKRLFTVESAVLHIEGLILSNGNATYGGAIAATRSNLSMIQTSCSGNIASSYGGAVYVGRSSTIAWDGQTILTDNRGGRGGGAVTISMNSTSTWSGPTNFSDNTAAGDGGFGGAVYVNDYSRVSWVEVTHFSNNTASEYGGALFVQDNSVASGNGVTSIVGNTARFGGGVFVEKFATVSWTAETSFINNNATENGGALFADENAAASWDGYTSFIENTASFGGAVFVEEFASVSWTAETSFINNSASESGGALMVQEYSAASWNGGTTFAGNTASFGGAVLVQEFSNLSWTNETSFINNTASENGGALFADDNATASWDGYTSFIGNTASFGGGVFVEEYASVSWTAETSFINNNATENGGALFADENATASWDGVTSFIGNTARFGGGVFVEEYASVSWTAKTSYFNNSASSTGGAVYIDEYSIATWDGVTSFSDNRAGFGGAIYVGVVSRVSWAAETSFINNTANSHGGALLVHDKSVVFWNSNTYFIANRAGFGEMVSVDSFSNVSLTAETSFINNTASSGGAMLVDQHSSVSWTEETTFRNNTAVSYGGAFYVDETSKASWHGVTSFTMNTAGYGGAVSVNDNSVVLWSAETLFEQNRAWIGDGGALRIRFESSASWTGDTLFIGNRANSSGGAMYVSTSSNVTMEGDTRFLDNYATVDGGAVLIYVGYDQEILSYILIAEDAGMVLRGNSCGANGGGIAFVGAVVIRFSSNMTFSENNAGVAGGAVYMSGVTFGPRFENAVFYSNSAVVGGGVYATGSGIAAVGDEDEDLQQNATIFNGCEFIENVAMTTGGALNTGAGIDLIEDTSFIGNTAAIGGALRLVGRASLAGCEFVDNLSDEEEGPAIFNDGIISSVSRCNFSGNVFNCGPGSYLAYNETDALFSTVCKGCGNMNCRECIIAGREPVCLRELGHTRAMGVNDTIESLSIDKGYWRATSTSTDIFACYNTEACVGGLTGHAGYCRNGYEGPYCSVCSQGYTASLGFACTKCSETITGGIVVAVILVVVFIIVCLAFISYMLSGKSEATDKGIVARLTRFIPLQSVKIVIVVWQIITQDFLDGVDILNFDLSWVISIGCIVDIDFHDQLLFATLGPLVAMAILGGTYVAGMRGTDVSGNACRIIRRKHVSMVLLLTFLVYSPTSSTLFKMFACDDLDDDKIYLRADYRIECDSLRHIAFQTYAGFMVLLYVVGIPTFYGVVLYNNREALKIDAGREEDESIKPITDLWKPYRPDRFFYEVIECQRRVLLTGVLVFIYPNTAAQIAIALMMATFFVFVSEALAPHASLWDAWCSRTGNAIVFTTIFLALLLKVDVSGDRASAQRTFEWVLVSAHSCLVFTVAVEAVAMFIAWKEAVREDSAPRVRPSVNISPSGVNRGRVFLVEDEASPHFEGQEI